MTTMPDMPPEIAALPVDARRNLPIPFMNQRADGSHDFLSIYAPHVVACLTDNLCGVCGQPLSYASAFVGGPLSARSRVYTDPPFHPKCAEFSMTVCPHIVIPHAKRATESRMARESGPVVTHESATLDKPQEWVINIAPTVETRYEFRDDGIFIYSGKPTKRITYRYVDDKLVRV